MKKWRTMKSVVAVAKEGVVPMQKAAAMPGVAVMQVVEVMLEELGVLVGVGGVLLGAVGMPGEV